MYVFLSKTILRKSIIIYSQFVNNKKFSKKQVQYFLSPHLLGLKNGLTESMRFCRKPVQPLVN